MFCLQVSGDNPVFVESVKPGGAAQIAGLVAGDMILKVCIEHIVTLLLNTSLKNNYFINFTGQWTRSSPGETSNSCEFNKRLVHLFSIFIYSVYNCIS